jgi:hypothetical protein
MTIKESSRASILEKLARPQRISEGVIDKGSIFGSALHVIYWIAIALLATLWFSFGFAIEPAQVFGWAADCRPEASGENYIGVRYKALLVEDELSETGWVLLFAGSGFTNNGEYQPHFVDLIS